jgi:hypothetical protein
VAPATGFPAASTTLPSNGPTVLSAVLSVKTGEARIANANPTKKTKIPTARRKFRMIPSLSKTAV